MYKKQIGQQILFLLSVFLCSYFFVRVDSLQYPKPIMPERGIVTVCIIFNKHFHSGILLLPLSKLSSRTGNGGSPSTFNFIKVRPL